MKTPKTPNDFLLAARKEHKDIETKAGILCVGCFESLWSMGEYNGSEVERLIPLSDACYNCHPDD